MVCRYAGKCVDELQAAFGVSHTCTQVSIFGCSGGTQGGPVDNSMLVFVLAQKMGCPSEGINIYLVEIQDSGWMKVRLLVECTFGIEW